MWFEVVCRYGICVEKCGVVVPLSSAGRFSVQVQLVVSNHNHTNLNNAVKGPYAVFGIYLHGCTVYYSVTTL